MLARLYLRVPFNIAIAKDEKFPIFGYESDGYKIRILPPGYDEATGDATESVTINGAQAVIANIVRIDFHKETFDRTSGAAFDPPEAVIQKAVRSFVTRLRHAARAHFITPVDFLRCTWRLEYCDDNGVQVPSAEGFFRARGGTTVTFGGYTGLTPELWTAIRELGSEYEPPPWDVLLLDALAELPKVGTSIVLAATALEVFIAHVLNELANEQPEIAGLWEWTNNRDYRQAPTVEEQYDSLLKLLAGHSLKDELALWETFKNLKQARNTFVHEGSARVGTTRCDAKRANDLINNATKVTAKIREWLPEHLQWKAFDLSMSVVLTKNIGLPPSVGEVGMVPSDETPQDKQ